MLVFSFKLVSPLVMWIIVFVFSLLVIFVHSCLDYLQKRTTYFHILLIFFKLPFYLRCFLPWRCRVSFSFRKPELTASALHAKVIPHEDICDTVFLFFLLSHSFNIVNQESAPMEFSLHRWLPPSRWETFGQMLCDSLSFSIFFIVGLRGKCRHVGKD